MDDSNCGLVAVLNYRIGGRKRFLGSNMHDCLILSMQSLIDKIVTMIERPKTIGTTCIRPIDDSDREKFPERVVDDSR